MKKVKFGSYWKNNARKKHLKWLVLDEKDGKTLLLAKHGLDCRQYGTYGTSCSTTWENCDLRKWLQSTFINNAFSEEEQQAIVLTKNDTKGSRTTEDKVFLLSIEEAQKYFKNAEERKCMPTPYAKLHNAWSSDDNLCYWWLRSPGITQNNAAIVHSNGNVYGDGYYVFDVSTTIRVAMWVNSSKLEIIKNR